jgi:hypothetical protein
MRDIQLTRARLLARVPGGQERAEDALKQAKMLEATMAPMPPLEESGNIRPH